MEKEEKKDKKEKKAEEEKQEQKKEEEKKDGEKAWSEDMMIGDLADGLHRTCGAEAVSTGGPWAKFAPPSLPAAVTRDWPWLLRWLG